MGRRGFTLVELMVSLLIGAFIIAATLTFTTEQVRLLDFTDDRIGLQQEGRALLDLMAADIRQAGLGVGYRSDGRFAGLRRGTFSVAGGATFFADDGTVPGPTGPVPTDDLGLRFVRGEVRTITMYNATEGQVCSGGKFRNGDLVLMMTRDGLHAQTAKITGLTGDACRRSFCVDGCETFQFDLDPTYVSSPDAAVARYQDGELFGGFEEVVYFVDFDSRMNANTLRRAVVTTDSPCSARDETCGARMARGVDAMHVRVWMLNEATQVWDDVTSAPSIDESAPLRVDLEIVMRGEADIRTSYKAPAVLALAPGTCIPGPCGADGDNHHRDVLRTSVELRNAGKMRIQ